MTYYPDKCISSKAPFFCLKVFSANEPLPLHIIERRHYARFISELSDEFYGAMFDYLWDTRIQSMDEYKAQFGFTSFAYTRNV